MSSFAARSGVILVITLLFATSPAVAQRDMAPATSAYDAAAQYRAVHVDTLDPYLQSLFEHARREWLTVLAKHHTSDGRGFMFDCDGHTVITLHSFNTFAEYAALREFRGSIKGRLGTDASALERYDSGDVALRTPHNSEVWSRDTDMDYRGSQGMLDEYSAGYMQMIVSHVDSDDYARAWKEIDAALRSAGYPLSRRGFFSSLGSGNNITLWLATSRKAFDEAGPPLAAVARILGPTKAQGLFERVKAATSSLQVHDLSSRAELQSPE